MFSIFNVLVLTLSYQGCEAMTKTKFNDHIRDFSDIEGNINLTDVKTLHKHDVGPRRYTGFIPVAKYINHKNGADNALADSSHGRALFHGPSGYGYTDYDYGHGYEHGPDHYPPDDHHYDFHYPIHHTPGYHHGGHGPYYKQYDHGLATKTLLLPLAGLALLGAAAALVTNPVLLQLGVVSGKRRRRHAEEIEKIASDSIRKWTPISADRNIKDFGEKNETVSRKRMLRKNEPKTVNRINEEEKDNGDVLVVSGDNEIYTYDDLRFIPIPLKVKHP